MPATYTLIDSEVLTASQTSVTFSAIPATYTDLVFRISARTNNASTSDELYITFNSDTASNYSTTVMFGFNSTAYSFRSSSSTPKAVSRPAYINGDTTTSNTFSNTEIYIPSYTVSQNKPFSTNNMMENNNSGLAYTQAIANLWRNTSAITDVKFEITGTNNFVSGSSFYLYGISNA
jgi:hypothetical protein